MVRIFFFISTLILLTSCSYNTGNTLQTDYEDEKFEVGQIWHYNTRVGETNSTIQIVKIDKYKNEDAFIHISVDGLKMKNLNIESGVSETIGHLPFTRKAMLQSVTKLVESNAELTDYEDGYKTWKEAFETEQGGVFTITIKEAIKHLETTMNQ